MGLFVTVATLAVAALASLFMAWAIGAGSSGSTPFAPAVGANAISVMQAAFVVGLLGLAGAVLQGANVSETVGSGLVLFPDGGGLTPAASILLLLIAGGLVAIGVFTGYPIATAFTVTGAVVGVGLALGGQPAWATYQEIVALWVATPFLGGGIAYVTARWLQSGIGGEDRIVAALAGLIGVILANIEFSVLGGAGEGASIAVAVSRALGGPPLGPVLVTVALAALAAGSLYRSLRIDRAAAQRQFLLVLGGLVAFSAGGWGVQVAGLWVALEAFGATVPPYVPLFVVPLGTIASALPTPGGLGGIETAQVSLLALATDVPAAMAAAAVAVFSVGGLLLTISIGAAAVVVLQARKRTLPLR